VERFNLRKLNDLDVKKWYQIKVSNRFRALENLNESGHIIGFGKTLKRICKPTKQSVGMYELKQH